MSIRLGRLILAEGAMADDDLGPFPSLGNGFAPTEPFWDKKAPVRGFGKCDGGDVTNAKE